MVSLKRGMRRPSTFDLSPWLTLAQDREGRRTQDQGLFQLWSPVGSEFRSENELHHLGVAGRPGFDFVRFQILIVDTPSSGGYARVEVLQQSFADRAQIRARARIQPGAHLSRTGSVQAARDLAVNRPPPGDMMRRRAAQQ